MAGGEIVIRALTPTDAAAYRDIRLAALLGDPDAFSSTYGAESSRDTAWFGERLGTAKVFGAFQGETLVGTAGFFVQKGEKETHKGMLWTVYVRPEMRGLGVGRRLIDAVLDYARGQVELIQLTVSSTNQPARRLYAAADFIEYGVEKNALKQDGRYSDEVLMAKQFAGAPD